LREITKQFATMVCCVGIILTGYFLQTAPIRIHQPREAGRLANLITLVAGAFRGSAY
jgi:hypothetical protein